MSGPIERGSSGLSGPLYSTCLGLGNTNSNGVAYSAPLSSGMYGGRKGRRGGVRGIKKAFSRSFPRPWVVPVRNNSFVKENLVYVGEVKNERDVQCAFEKAGEDKVHVVVSEERGWLFVGIYDGLMVLMLLSF